MERVLYRIWLWMYRRYGFRLPVVYYTPEALRKLESTLAFSSAVFQGQPLPTPSDEPVSFRRAE
jgi:hypothetical protein